MIMKYRLLLLPLLAAVTVTAVHADDPYDAFKKQMEEGYSRFSQKTNSEYDTFRDQINTKYAEFLADPWQETKKMAPVRNRSISLTTTLRRRVSRAPSSSRRK